jgi:integrase
MNERKADAIRAELMENIRMGKRPQTLREKREVEQRQIEAEEAEAEQRKRDQITFDTAFQAFLKWGKTNKKSWKDDEGRYAGYVKKVIGNLSMKEIAPIHIERIRSNMKKQKLSEKTIHLTFTLIRAVYRKAAVWGMYSGEIPTSKVTWPSLDNNRTRFLSHEEAKQLLAAVKEKSLTVYHQCIFALHCGLRFSEIANLKWSDVDLKHGTIYIRDAKAGKSREAYITKTVQEILEFIRDVNQPGQDGLVFPAKTGGPQQHVSTTFYQVVKDSGLNAGIQDRRRKICFHSLRHSFGSWLAMQGTSLYEIKELMGHSDIKMTERYSHLLPSVKRDAVNRMAETFDQAQTDQAKKQKKSAD